MLGLCRLLAEGGQGAVAADVVPQGHGGWQGPLGPLAPTPAQAGCPGPHPGGF